MRYTLNAISYISFAFFNPKLYNDSLNIGLFCAPIAQLDRVSDYESAG